MHLYVGAKNDNLGESKLMPKRETKTPNKRKNAPIMLTLSETAKKLGVGVSKVVELCDQQKLAHIDMGTARRHYLFVPETAIKLYRQNIETRSQRNTQVLQKKLERYEHIYGELPKVIIKNARMRKV